MTQSLFCAIPNQHTTSPFGDNRNHQGRDSRAPIGTEVFGSGDGGTVVAVKLNDPVYGVMVDTAYTVDGARIVKRDGHLSEALVKVGDPVSLLTVIGLTGDTGIARGPHLHEGVIRNGKACDPDLYLNPRTAIPEREEDMRLYEKNAGTPADPVRSGRFALGAPGVWHEFGSDALGGDKAARAVAVQAFGEPVFMLTGDFNAVGALYRASAAAGGTADQKPVLDAIKALPSTILQRFREFWSTGK